MTIRDLDGIKVETATFVNYSTNKGIVVEISFPHINQDKFDDIELHDDIDNFFFEHAEKGVMSGEKDVYSRKTDSTEIMKWEITVYCDEDDEDEDNDEASEKV